MLFKRKRDIIQVILMPYKYESTKRAIHAYQKRNYETILEKNREYSKTDIGRQKNKERQLRFLQKQKLLLDEFKRLSLIYI